MAKTFSDEAECCKGVCKPQSTSMFDNAECSIEFEQHYADEAEAQDTLDFLTQKARKIETEPCDIESKIEPIDNGVRLYAKFTFSCQAETVLFQLSLR
ncbi:YfcZ/YiiS family protein [Glaesserella sp.]|uniref:YfcZ/YiiS family protein n=1 Tax=Glaesserella sp. TaxID=2094731 RepID=UPI0035A1C089